jgi:hypothetical protein
MLAKQTAQELEHVAEVAAVPIDEERPVVFVRLQHEPELCAIVCNCVQLCAIVCVCCFWVAVVLPCCERSSVWKVRVLPRGAGARREGSNSHLTGERVVRV